MSNIDAMGDIATMDGVVVMGDIVATVPLRVLAEDKNESINSLQLLRKEVVPGVEMMSRHGDTTGQQNKKRTKQLCMQGV